MTVIVPIPFEAEWPDADLRLLRSELPHPPPLPLFEVLSPRWAAWVASAAEEKGAPADYVFAALISVSSTLIGNTRWASPWSGWAEPPVIWAMAIGNPSAGKSPALDAVLAPVKNAEKKQRDKAQKAHAEWRKRAEVAKLVESAWKDAVKAASKAGEILPAKPKDAAAGPEPSMPRLVLSDATIEKLVVILSEQPRGTLLARDELAGWLQGMARYSGGGSDRPFWLEAYGGRPYTVERLGREPVYVDQLTVGVLGGIQPDRMRKLLKKTDDDGLLARLMPIWPDPAPLKRPGGQADADLMETAVERLLGLSMNRNEDGHHTPSILPFGEGAKLLMDDFRKQVRAYEADANGLVLSFVGKLPGLAVRLALVLGMLDWASDEEDEPCEITASHFRRAVHLLDAYALPMARRSFADANCPERERSARGVIGLIRELGSKQFSTRDLQRMDRDGLNSMDQLNPAFAVLEEAGLIRQIPTESSPRGGRKSRLFAVNPLVHTQSG